MTQTIAHLVNCVVIDCDDGFDKVRQCCESLLPATDLAGLTQVPQHVYVNSTEVCHSGLRSRIDREARRSHE